MPDCELVHFENRTAEDRRRLRQFVNFHWDLYRDQPQYIPLLDYEYLGSRLIGMTGYFEPRHLFYQHGEITFFMVLRAGKTIGRVCAFINHQHNEHTGAKTGFFGHYECIDDPEISNLLLSACADWLRERGMSTMRGPQNFPINEATPGVLTAGFDTHPVIYYHWNFPYYEKLIRAAGMAPIKRVVSETIKVKAPIMERVGKVVERLRNRPDVEVKSFDTKKFEQYAHWMLDLYNASWNDNWGFVPMRWDEFYRNLKDMQLVWDPELFVFAFVNGKPASFLGLVPNICDVMKPIPGMRRAELLRAARMILTKGRLNNLRLGYLGTDPQYRKLGLDALLIIEGQNRLIAKGYEYSDVGWMLEDNVLILRLAASIGAYPARTYTVFERQL